jgi:glycosyltransferase involved in cell wall biosynthesis
MREPDPAPEVSVVMPCLNEARTIAGCIREAQAAFAAAGIAGEVVIADNGSTDGSQDLATAAGARVVPVAARGYGNALRGGIAAARGRFIIMGDADGSYDYSHLPRFVERLRAGDDLVMGNRFRGGVQPGAMPWKNRYLGNPTLSFIGRLFFPTVIRDFHCGLRGFTADAYRRMQLRTTGM